MDDMTQEVPQPTRAGFWRRVLAFAIDGLLLGVVGNEDGAHHVTATVFQALNDVGWTIAAGGADYWVGEAMQDKDFKDLETIPEPVAQGAAMLAANAVHLATMLKEKPYPGLPETK